MMGPPDYLGPGVIANRLNKEHPDLPVPITHVNIINFRSAQKSKALKQMGRREVEETFIDPLKQAREDLAELREKVLPKYKMAIKKGDPKAIRALNKAFMDLFDRFAKLEHIIEPRAEMKVKYMQVNQQFNAVVAELMGAWREFCPNCQAIMMDRVSSLRPSMVSVASMEPKKVITVDALEVSENP